MSIIRSTTPHSKARFRIVLQATTFAALGLAGSLLLVPVAGDARAMSHNDESGATDMSPNGMGMQNKKLRGMAVDKFNQLDENGDKVIDRDEYARAASRRFDGMDSDGDNKITLGEFQEKIRKAHEKMKDRKQDMKPGHDR